MRLFRGHLAIGKESNRLSPISRCFVEINRFGIKICFLKGFVWYKTLKYS